MGAAATSLPVSSSRWGWLWNLLREDLAPYPGRLALVARMVVASTLVMIVTMTFRIPYGAYGAIYALTISRESPQETVQAVWTMAFAFAAAAVDVLLGAVFFVDEPLVRVLWVIVTLFLMFFTLSVSRDFVGATRFGYLLVITIPLWDQQIPADVRVEQTLWAVGAITIGSAITALLEVGFAAFQPGDHVTVGVATRLFAVEELLTCYAQACPAGQSLKKRIAQAATVGTSRLRRSLRRANRPQQYRERMGAVVALTGRLVDLAASLEYVGVEACDSDRQRIRFVAERISGIRASLLGRRATPEPRVEPESDSAATIPLVREMEATIRLISQVLQGSFSLSAYLPVESDDARPRGWLVPDAFSNPDHFKFALRGCLAASLCYLIYNLLFWPGISTAITTCLLTALTTIGGSHQKQFLRFAGALIGGFGLGMGAQVFILPSIDSIAGFSLVFMVVTALASWIATSSSRLSYFGVQIAVAFCLIHLEEFAIQTSLTVARDRVVGILLGLGMMWLAFDRLGGVSAATEMKRAFLASLRLLAQLSREPLTPDVRAALARSYSLRDTINKNFDKVRSSADGVLFEFGRSRERDLALRDRIREWQPQLRTLFVLRVALQKYRLFLPGFVLPPAMRPEQREFDSRWAAILEGMAARLEGGEVPAPKRLEDSLERFEQLAKSAESSGAEPEERALAAELPTFLALSRTITSLTVSLDRQIV
jgi:multidrug resistance protein MdtO